MHFEAFLCIFSQPSPANFPFPTEALAKSMCHNRPILEKACNDLATKPSISLLTCEPKTYMSYHFRICTCSSTEQHYSQQTCSKIPFYSVQTEKQKTIQDSTFLVDSKCAPRPDLNL